MDLPDYENKERELTPLYMKRAILRARARLLARPPVEPEPEKTTIEVVKFILSNEVYAVETKQIREVHSLKEVTKLPSAPAFVVGVISIRGQIITVFDIRRFFELPQLDVTIFNKVIVVEAHGVILGFTADDVLGVELIEEAAVQLSLSSLAGKRSNFISGITTDKVTILDVEKMLKDKSILVEEYVD